MGSELVAMEQEEYLLSVECPEPEGTVVRSVKPGYISFERIQFLWDKLSQFDTLFNDFVAGDFGAFVSHFVKQDAAGVPVAQGLLWEVDDVGIFFLNEIVPLESANAHFVFWDRRFKGREELCRRMVKYAFDTFGFHRIKTEVPLYAKGIYKAVERIGFVKEGRLREAVLFKGEWFDVNIYSILRSEVENGRSTD